MLNYYKVRIEKMGKPQILVLEPTRELAHQVAEQFVDYGKHTPLKVALLHGGVGYGKQDEEIKVADVVVATPGRLIDHFYRGTMRFGEIKILILDEVDRMLDMGFLPIVRRIVSLCPWKMPAEPADPQNKRAATPATDRQTLFFSATMPPPLSNLQIGVSPILPKCKLHVDRWPRPSLMRFIPSPWISVTSSY